MVFRTNRIFTTVKSLCCDSDHKKIAVVCGGMNSLNVVKDNLYDWLRKYPDDSEICIKPGNNIFTYKDTKVHLITWSQLHQLRGWWPDFIVTDREVDEYISKVEFLMTNSQGNIICADR